MDDIEDLLGLNKTKLDERFWRGEGSDMGHVKALPQRTFRQLVDEVIDAPAVLNITRHQYDNMSKDERNKAKRVRYLVPSAFGTKEARRRTEYATTVSLICLDVDEAQHASPYYRAPETLGTQLDQFNFTVYATASSTPDAPRVRIMVEADALDPKLYVAALHDIAARIGLAKVTRESKPHVQPMYLPTLFKGDTDDNYPILYSVVDQRAYTHEDIIYGEDADAFDNIPPTPTGTDDLGDLEFLRPPVEEVTLQDVSAALRHIDPDIDYHDWLKVATGMKHQFQRDDTKHQAYALFDDWSSKGEKYQGQDETLYKWRSFNITPKDRLPVTIRTVFRIAALNGWDSHHVRLKCFSACREWINSGEVAVEQLFDNGVTKIASVPLLTKSQEEVLLRDLAKQCKKGDMETSLPSLRKDLQRIRKAEQKKKASKQKTPTWAKDFCYLSGRNQFLRTTTQEFFSPEALDRTFGKHLLAFGEEATGPSSDVSEEGARPAVRPQDYLLNTIEIPTPYEVIYDPQNPNDRYIRQDGRLYVNTYTNNQPQPDILGADEAGQLFTKHLETLIAEKEYRHTLMDYLAYLVQYPGYKIRWAVMLQGVEGCGKTFLVEALSHVFGQGHVGIIDINAMRSGWNDWAYGRQLIAIEEVRVSGQNRYEVMNAIKPLITNDHITINQRFVSSQVVRNNANYMLFTNHHDALALTDNDRRYFIVKSALQRKGQVRDLPDGYFKELFGMLHENAGGLRYFLENWDISKSFNPDGDAPDTSYKTEVVDETGGSLQKAITEILDESTNDWVRHGRVASSMLKDMLAMSGEQVTVQTLGAALRHMGYTNAGRQTVDMGERQRIWTKSIAGSDLL